MKNLVILFTFLFFAGFACKSDSKKDSEQSNEDDAKAHLAGQVNIVGSEAMYPLVKIWADEFMKVYPKAKVKVISKSGIEGIKSVKEGKADFAMLARSLNEDEKGLWPIPVARDAVVAIINVNNPDLQNIMNWGMDQTKFNKIFVAGTINNWKDVYSNKNIDEPIKVYRLSDKNCAAKVWAEFVEATQESPMLGEEFDLDSRLINAVKMDRNGIGFINLAFAYDNYTKYEHSEFKVIPIDFNSNELIDDDEFIYHNKNRLLDAVKDERFKRPPARNLYLVSSKKPTDALNKAFVKWILSTGMNFMKDAGYVMLDADESSEIVKKL
jgi:phosphate transport system substrate-binding protein